MASKKAYIRAALRRAIYARDGLACVYCNRIARHRSVDHIKPSSAGGKTVAHNLVMCCLECNKAKAAWPVDLFAELMARKGYAADKGVILRRLYNRIARPLPKV